jgi:hypothetical protein
MAQTEWKGAQQVINPWTNAVVTGLMWAILPVLGGIGLALVVRTDPTAPPGNNFFMYFIAIGCGLGAITFLSVSLVMLLSGLRPGNHPVTLDSNALTSDDLARAAAAAASEGVLLAATGARIYTPITSQAAAYSQEGDLFVKEKRLDGFLSYPWNDIASAENSDSLVTLRARGRFFDIPLLMHPIRIRFTSPADADSFVASVRGHIYV